MEKKMSIGEFHTRSNMLINVIRNRVYKEKHTPLPYIYVRVMVYCNGELVDVTEEDIESIVLTDDKPTVYHFVSGGWDTNSSTRVVFNAKEIIRKPKNNFDFHFVRREFNHYEDYLNFVTTAYKKCNPNHHSGVSIWTNTKMGDLGVPSILRKTLRDAFPDVDLRCSSFMLLEEYRELPEDVKHKVDELTAPVVIDSDSVEVRSTPGYLTVTLRQELAENYFVTGNFDDLVEKAFDSETPIP